MVYREPSKSGIMPTAMSSNHSPPKNSKISSGVTIDGLSGLRELRQQFRQADSSPDKVQVSSRSDHGQVSKSFSESAPALSQHKPTNEAKSPTRQRVDAEQTQQTGLPFRNPPPVITYPEELPVSGRRAEIAEALQKNQVIIVCG